MDCERVRIESISNEHWFPLYNVKMNDGKLLVEARTHFGLPFQSPTDTNFSSET